MCATRPAFAEPAPTLEFMASHARALLGSHVHLASGRLYNVLHNALCERTLAPLVVYAQLESSSEAPGRRATAAGTVWVRPASDFARKFAPAPPPGHRRT